MNNESSLSDWRQMALALLCLGLLGIQTTESQAESQTQSMYQKPMYQKSPRLSPRNRQMVPAPSPLLEAAPTQKPVAASDPRIHNAPPPPLEPGYVPVSNDRTEALPSAQTNATQPLKPQNTTHPASPQRHPVVAVPAGQQWEPSTPAPPAAEKRQPEKHQIITVTPSAPETDVDAPPAVASKPTSKTRQQRPNTTKKPVQGSVAVTRSPDTTATALKQTAVNSAQPSATAKTNTSEKPLVHFPEDLRTATQSAGQNGMERGFYPVGYRPYLPPTLIPEKSKTYQAALLHYNRASFYGHTNQLSEAIREYQEAIRQQPALGDAYVGLSSVYLFQSNWEDVILNAHKALTLKSGFIDPVNITQARYNLSTAYCAAADYGKANRFYKMVKSANHPKAEQLGRYLERNCKP